jgi:RHS repeat-associated protein
MNLTGHFVMLNSGNTASIVGVETYSYDFESHMTQREAGGGSTDTHEYDGDGRTMRSKLDDASDWTHFTHDELTENLICEYMLISGTFTIKALNTYGLGLNSSNRQGTIRYFHFDGLGTTYYLTDSSQSVTDSCSYDAFGVPISATGSSVNPYRYVGQWGYYDDGAMGSSSGVLLLGVRYYWPRYGRFSVWDPQSGADYLYCINSPLNLTDSTGHSPLFGLCVEFMCSGYKAASMGSEFSSSLGGLLKYIAGRMQDFLLETFRVFPKDTKACATDAKSAKPKTLLGSAIRSLCLGLAGGKRKVPGACYAYYKQFEYSDINLDVKCRDCCDSIFPDTGKYAKDNELFRGKCKDFCNTLQGVCQ